MSLVHGSSASLPLTGPLSVFGPQIRTGYQLAVDDVNGAGGLNIAGSRRMVALHVLDDQSDPNRASAQGRTLILRDNAVALLGAATRRSTIPSLSSRTSSSVRW
jgi:branched-chain amino acid transport system substrate-binding protein